MLIESILSGYELLFEAVSINKQFLLKEAGSPEALAQTISHVNELWSADNMDTFIPKKDKILPFLYLMTIRDNEIVNKDTMQFLHDLASARKLNLLDKLNSDYTAEEFKTFVANGKRGLQNLGDLTEDEEKIWLRVKVFHDFNDGYQWVVALNEDGEVSGYMPSCITQKTASHCGNQPSVQEGDEYFELRKNNKPYLTVIINNGKIQESKSYGNKKNANSESVLPYLKWLFKHEHVTGVGERYDYGYSPDTNMGIKDFFGIDDEFVDEIERDKPKLIGTTERKIIDYKRKLKSGEITETDIINDFNEKRIKLWDLRGILGKLPFTEEQLSAYIKNKTLDTIDIANTSTKLLTDNIQNELLKYDKKAPATLIPMQEQVPTANIDINHILENHPRALLHMTNNQLLEFMDKYADSYVKGLKHDPGAFKYSSIFPSDQMDLFFKKYTNELNDFITQNPVIIKYIPEHIVHQFIASLATGIKTHPHMTTYIPQHILDMLYFPR
jgi:hypothetical protein